MWWMLATAQAGGYAIVPFEPGEVDQERPGLGRALAAMAVTDLHGAGVSLVERARVDAMMDELSLTASSFVDPANANAIGKELAAQGLVLGTYSVVEGELTLDLRVVDTETSAIVGTARANGPLPRFVQIGQSATEQLVEPLGGGSGAGPSARYTYDFEAFEHWAAGLEADRRGELEQARLAYGRALDRDGGFEAASAALVRARERVAANRREQIDSTGAPRLAQARRVVRATEAISDSDVAETDVVVRLAYRWTALADLGLHCQRQEEMLSFLDRHGWVLPALSGEEVDRIGQELATRWKIERSPTPSWGPPATRGLGWQARIQLFADLPTFFSATTRVGLLASVNQCLLPSEELALLKHLAKRTKGMPGAGGVDLSTLLTLHRLGRQAYLLGPDDAWDGEMARLELRIRPGFPGYDLHQQQRQQILAAAEDHTKRARFRGAFSPTDLLGLAKAGLPVREGETCTLARERWAARTEKLLPQYETLAAHGDGREEPLLDPLAPHARAAALFGCLPGHPKRVGTAVELQALVLASVDKAGDGAELACGKARTDLSVAAGPENTASLEGAAAQLDLALQLFDAVARDCVAGSF